MKNKDLIELLSKANPEATVCVASGYSLGDSPIKDCEIWYDKTENKIWISYYPIKNSKLLRR